MRKTTAASTKIAGIDLAGMIDREAKDAKLYQPATLISRSPRQPETGNLAGGTRSRETRIPCRGIREEVATPGEREVTVMLYGASIILGGERVVPVPGDAVTIRGETFEIVEVEDDPAAATYSCKTAGSGPGVR